MWCLAKDRGKLELRHLYFDRPCGKLLFRLVGMKPINFWRNFLNSAFKIIDRLFWLWINKLCFYKRLKTFEMTKWNILQVSKDGKWLLSQMPSRARARILDWDHSFVTCWQAFCCTLKKKRKTSQAENSSETFPNWPTCSSRKLPREHKAPAAAPKTSAKKWHLK